MNLDRFQLGNLEDDYHFISFSDGKHEDLHDDKDLIKADSYKDEDID